MLNHLSWDFSPVAYLQPVPQVGIICTQASTHLGHSPNGNVPMMPLVLRGRVLSTPLLLWRRSSRSVGHLRVGKHPPRSALTLPPGYRSLCLKIHRLLRNLPHRALGQRQVSRRPHSLALTLQLGRTSLCLTSHRLLWSLTCSALAHRQFAHRLLRFTLTLPSVNLIPVTSTCLHLPER